MGAECGGSAQGIVGESPPASRPCEEGPVQALELHPSARPPTSGQERAHPALSSEWTNKAAQLNVNNMFAQSLRWNAHAGLTQLGSGRAVERGLRMRERRAGGPRTPGPGPGGDPGREPSLPLRLALCPQGRSGGAAGPRPWEQVPGASRPGLGGALAAPPPHPQGPYRGLALGQDPSASPPVWPRPSQGIQWDPSIGAFSSQGFSYTQEGTWERDTGVDRPGPLPAVPQGARCRGLGSAVPRSPEYVSPRRPCHAPSADGRV